jgi:hypothetical protein
VVELFVNKASVIIYPADNQSNQRQHKPIIFQLIVIPMKMLCASYFFMYIYLSSDINKEEYVCFLLPLGVHMNLRDFVRGLIDYKFKNFGTFREGDNIDIDALAFYSRKYMGLFKPKMPEFDEEKGHTEREYYMARIKYQQECLAFSKLEAELYVFDPADKKNIIAVTDAFVNQFHEEYERHPFLRKPSLGAVIPAKGALKALVSFYCIAGVIGLKSADRFAGLFFEPGLFPYSALHMMVMGLTAAVFISMSLAVVSAVTLTKRVITPPTKRIITPPLRDPIYALDKLQQDYGLSRQDAFDALSTAPDVSLDDIIKNTPPPAMKPTFHKVGKSPLPSQEDTHHRNHMHL